MTMQLVNQDTTAVKEEDRRLHVSNPKFLESLFGALGPRERIWTTEFATDPSKTICIEWNGHPGVIEDDSIPAREGYNNYFCISVLRLDTEGSVRRRQQYMSRLPLIVLDDLGTKANMPELPLTYLLRTSPNSYQGGFKLADPITDDRVAQRLMQALAERQGVTDQSGNNPVRYMRLPHGCNTKLKYGGAFTQVLEQWHPERTYTLEQVCHALSIDFHFITTGGQAVKKEAGSLLPDVPPPFTQENWCDDVMQALVKAGRKKYPLTPENIAIVKDMLKLFMPDNGVQGGGTYIKWRNTVWAIASLRWGDAGRDLAKHWSMNGGLYSDSSFDAVWNSFDERDGGVKAGTLFRYAQDANYTGPLLSSTSPNGIVEEESTDLPPWLKQMNDRYAWVERYASVYRFEFDDFLDLSRFRAAHDNEQVPNVGAMKGKWIGKGTAWIRHPQRRQHRDVVMRPDVGAITADGCINTWQGFCVTPLTGDVAPWLKLLRRMFPGSEREFVLKWLAHLVQHPAEKLNTALVIWSQQQGVGKNLLFEIFVSMIGDKHAAVISQDALDDKYNGWAANRILVIADEALGTGKRQDANKLKGLITGGKLRMNEKYQPAREIDNRMNFVFLSNHNDAVFIDDHDRRYFVCEVTAGRLPESEAKAYVAWRDNGGIAALLDYLSQIDLTGFDPKAAAPMTDAKQEMIEDGKSELERFISDLMQGDVGTLMGKEIVRAEDLCDLLDMYRGTRPSSKAVTNACKGHGAKQRRLSIGGAKVRVLAIGRNSNWQSRPNADWVEEFKKELVVSPLLHRPHAHMAASDQKNDGAAEQAVLRDF